MSILQSLGKTLGEHPGLLAAGAVGMAALHNDTFKDLPRDLTNDIVGAPVDEIVMGQKMDLGSILFDIVSPIKMPRLVNYLPEAENTLQYINKSTIGDAFMHTKDYARQYAEDDAASGYNDGGFVQSTLPPRPQRYAPVDGSVVFGMHNRRFR